MRKEEIPEGGGRRRLREVEEGRESGRWRREVGR